MLSTEKMLPAGMMPGKYEMEKYRELYRTPDYSLIPSIEAFDYRTLPEKYILTFCMSMCNRNSIILRKKS